LRFYIFTNLKNNHPSQLTVLTAFLKNDGFPSPVAT